MEKHGAGDRALEEIGTMKDGRRHYRVYKDSAGEYWYKVFLETEWGIVDERTAIFGRKRRKHENYFGNVPKRGNWKNNNR